jgi:hypothetical protein
MEQCISSVAFGFINTTLRTMGYDPFKLISHDRESKNGIKKKAQYLVTNLAAASSKVAPTFSALFALSECVPKFKLHNGNKLLTGSHLYAN